MVLLKNKENILPLRSDKRVALIGQIAKAEIGDTLIKFLQRYSSRFMGYEDGYDLTQNSNKQLIRSAKELAKRSDLGIAWLHLYPLWHSIVFLDYILAPESEGIYTISSE